MNFFATYLPLKYFIVHFRTRKTWSHAEVDSEVEEGLVELEVPLENEEVVLSWEGAAQARPLCAIANRARHGNKEDEAILVITFFIRRLFQKARPF